MTAKRDTKKSILAPIATAIAILAALPALLVTPLYLAGLMYELGYMGTYGVNSELFPRSVHDYLTYAYYGSVRLCEETLKAFKDYPLEIGISIFVVVALVVGFDRLFTHWAERLPIEAIRRFLDRLMNNRIFGAWLLPSAVISFLVWAVPYMALTIISLGLISPFAYHAAGERSARESIEKFKGCDMQAQPTIGCVRIMRNGKPLAAGKIIARGGAHIALYDGVTVRLYPVTEDVIEVGLMTPTVSQTQPTP